MKNELTLLPSGRPLSGPLAPAGECGVSERRLEKSDRILIVEDDLLVANQVEAALSDAGYDVAGTATSRDEALQLAEAESPVLVLMDIRLRGDADGIDTALDLFRLQGIRCIFASAYSDHEAQRRAAPAAPLGWLQKPYNMASLTAMVRAALNELKD
jgi:two-component system, response regulator PdtaR